MTDDEQAKNITTRQGVVSHMAHPEIVGGIIRWGDKRYRIDEQHHPVEVTDEAGCVEGCQSGDCQCDKGMSVCRP